MRQHGLPEQSLNNVFKSAVIPKLLYAAPAWWGFLSLQNKARFEAFLKRAVKFGFYHEKDANASALVTATETKLFNKVTFLPYHALSYLLPPRKQTNYNLRSCGFELPRKDDRNFLNRMIYKTTLSKRS